MPWVYYTRKRWFDIADPFCAFIDSCRFIGVCISVLQGMDHDAFEKKFNTMELGFLNSQQRFCQELLKVKAGQTAVVSNGRVRCYMCLVFFLLHFIHGQLYFWEERDLVSPMLAVSKKQHLQIKNSLYTVYYGRGHVLLLFFFIVFSWSPHNTKILSCDLDFNFSWSWYNKPWSRFLVIST